MRDSNASLAPYSRANYRMIVPAIFIWIFKKYFFKFFVNRLFKLTALINFSISAASSREIFLSTWDARISKSISLKRNNSIQAIKYSLEEGGKRPLPQRQLKVTRSIICKFGLLCIFRRLVYIVIHWQCVTILGTYTERQFYQKLLMLRPRSEYSMKILYHFLFILGIKLN